jgi:hypothetical protein
MALPSLYHKAALLCQVGENQARMHQVGSFWTAARLCRHLQVRAHRGRRGQLLAPCRAPATCQFLLNYMRGAGLK